MKKRLPTVAPIIESTSLNKTSIIISSIFTQLGHYSTLHLHVCEQNVYIKVLDEGKAPVCSSRWRQYKLHGMMCKHIKFQFN